MSINAFMLPAVPQTPAAGLSSPGKTGSASFQSCRPDRSTAEGQSFKATLNQISNNRCDRSADSTRPEKTGGVSDHSDTGPNIPGDMNKPGDNPQTGVEDRGLSESEQTDSCAHPLHPFWLIQQQFFNFLMSANGSFPAVDQADSTAATQPSLFDHLVTQLQPEGQAIQNGQVGIGLFEQLQANVSPQATNLYFFEQLAAGAFNHQDSGGAMGIWGYGSWMATLSAGNLSAQTEAVGPHANPALYQLLHLLGVDTPVLESAAQSDGAGEQKPAANPATIDLNAEFLIKMAAQSQQGGANISENTQATVAQNTKDGRLFPQNSGITAETKLQHETHNSQIHRLQAAERPSDQTASSKSGAEVAGAKPVDDVFNPRGGGFQNQMPQSAEIVDKVVRIEGDNKDSSLLYGQDQMSQRPAKFETATPTSVSAQHSLASKTLHQVVQRAVLSFNNGQNEVRIDLKPEFLGHIRMQIVTDSQQVAVKIVAESAFVKDMLDSHLNQLKADLQAQGLKVDELEVSVAHDSDSDTNDQTTAEKSKSGALREDTASDEEISEEPIESQVDGDQALAENAIDYFA